MASERGFSLLEVLLSVAFFAALVFSVLGWLNVLHQEAKFSNEVLAVSSSMTQIRYALADTEIYCTQNLGRDSSNAHRSFNYNNPAGISVSRIDFYDETLAAPLANAVTQGQALDPKSDVMLKSAMLKPVSLLSTGTSPTGQPTAAVLANLEFIFNKKSPGFEVVRKIPIYVTLINGKIEKCSTDISSFVINGRMCEISSDGYQIYDPASDTCQLISGVQWYPSGDQTQAACPAGTIPAVSDLEVNPSLVVCRSGSTDGNPIPSRTYESGYISSDNPPGWISSFDRATKSCHFLYIVGATPDPSKTAIKCAKVGVQR